MSSVAEFYRPEHLRPCDSEGFELPPWENPYFAIPPDDDQDQVEAFEPTAADVAWLNTHPLPRISGGAPEAFQPSDQDWEDYARWSAWQDRLEGIYGPHGVTDDDLNAAGLPVG